MRAATGNWRARRFLAWRLVWTDRDATLAADCRRFHSRAASGSLAVTHFEFVRMSAVHRVDGSVWPEVRSFIGGYFSGMALVAVGRKLPLFSVVQLCGF